MIPDTEIQPAPPDILNDQEVLQALLNTAPLGEVVLDADGRIIFCNAGAVRLAGADSSGDILGQRPGDALGCIHALSCPTGCGGSEFCESCGAQEAITTCLRGLPNARECRMTRVRNGTEEALDLLVSVTPVRGNLACTLVDIGHEKRRSALERVFLHDVLNLAGNVAALAAVVSETAQPAGDSAEYLRLLSCCARQPRRRDPRASRPFGSRERVPGAYRRAGSPAAAAGGNRQAVPATGGRPRDQYRG